MLTTFWMTFENDTRFGLWVKCFTRKNDKSNSTLESFKCDLFNESNLLMVYYLLNFTRKFN